MGRTQAKPTFAGEKTGATSREAAPGSDSKVIHSVVTCWSESTVLLESVKIWRSASLIGVAGWPSSFEIVARDIQRAYADALLDFDKDRDHEIRHTGTRHDFGIGSSINLLDGTSLPNTSPKRRSQLFLS